MDAEHLEKERRQFSEEVRTLYHGDPLAACAATLLVWAKTLPPQGSMAARCALLAEVVSQKIKVQEAQWVGHRAYESAVDELRWLLLEGGYPYDPEVESFDVLYQAVHENGDVVVSMRQRRLNLADRVQHPEIFKDRE